MPAVLLPVKKGGIMNARRIFTILLTIIVGTSLQVTPGYAGFGDLIKSIEKCLSGGELIDDRIISGLKEALTIGTGNAVGVVSKLDGYYKNPDIKILLPGSVQKADKVLRTVGYGDKLDEFEESMNRAAEQAAPEAKAIFLGAIKEMSFDDARKILEGEDNEATLYFKDKTGGRLHEIFKPIVHNAMSEVGVTKSYQELSDKVSTIPFTDSLNVDLDEYVTGKALDGLFFMVAEEEKKIRTDPAARVTDLLKDVFGGGD
jgi:hypothetical protein